MPVLVDLAERNWPAQDNDFPVVFEAGWTRIRLTLVHPDWPDGECIRMNVLWSSGDVGQFSSAGGIVRDKAGNPTGGTKTLIWDCPKPEGVTDATIRVSVLQGLRSAVLVEAF